MKKKHLALVIVVVLAVGVVVSAAVWKYQQTNHVSYSQLQSQNASLKKQVSTLQKENDTNKNSLILIQKTNTKLTQDKAQLCVQTKLARLPSLVCN